MEQHLERIIGSSFLLSLIILLLYFVQLNIFLLIGLYEYSQFYFMSTLRQRIRVTYWYYYHIPYLQYLKGVIIYLFLKYIIHKHFTILIYENIYSFFVYKLFKKTKQIAQQVIGTTNCISKFNTSALEINYSYFTPRTQFTLRCLDYLLITFIHIA